LPFDFFLGEPRTFHQTGNAGCPTSDHPQTIGCPRFRFWNLG
jgi:hypothetical protein